MCLRSRLGRTAVSLHKRTETTTVLEAAENPSCDDKGEQTAAAHAREVRHSLALHKRSVLTPPLCFPHLAFQLVQWAFYLVVCEHFPALSVLIFSS